MDRRAFLAVGAAAAAAALPAKAEEAAEAPPSHELSPIGLPVVVDDRIRNYVFVRLKLHLAEGQDPAVVREKDAHIRDSMVRMGHRRPFTLPDDPNRLNPAAMAGHAMAACVRVYGRGVVVRVQVTDQQPQRNVRPIRA